MTERALTEAELSLTVKEFAERFRGRKFTRLGDSTQDWTPCGYYTGESGRGAGANNGVLFRGSAPRPAVTEGWTSEYTWFGAPVYGACWPLSEMKLVEAAPGDPGYVPAVGERFGMGGFPVGQCQDTYRRLDDGALIQCQGRADHAAPHRDTTRRWWGGVDVGARCQVDRALAQCTHAAGHTDAHYSDVTGASWDRTITPTHQRGVYVPPAAEHPTSRCEARGFGGGLVCHGRAGHPGGHINSDGKLWMPATTPLAGIQRIQPRVEFERSPVVVGTTRHFIDADATGFADLLTHADAALTYLAGQVHPGETTAGRVHREGLVKRLMEALRRARGENGPLR